MSLSRRTLLAGSAATVGVAAGLAADFSLALWVRLDTVTAWSRIFDFGTGRSPATATWAFCTSTAPSWPATPA